MSKFKLRRLGVSENPGQFKPSLQACLEAVLEQSDVLMDEVFAGLSASLQMAKGQAALVAAQPQTRASILALLDQSLAVKHTFAQQLRACVFGGESSRSVGPSLVRFDDFQFLEAEQIDANIELALTQQSVLLAVEDVLPVLNAIVSNLMGWSSVQAHLNPIRPESFVQALRETLKLHLPSEAGCSAIMTLAAAKLGVGLK